MNESEKINKNTWILSESWKPVKQVSDDDPIVV